MLIFGDKMHEYGDVVFKHNHLSRRKEPVGGNYLC